MLAALIVLHVLVCIALIIVVLLQSGKGAEIGASFGAGASQTVFGATGGKSFMSRMTTAVAVIFMLTSLTLAYFYGKPSTTSVMPSQVPSAASQAQKAPTAAPPATPAPAKQAAPAEGAKK
ncbi:MAG: preprotein translocase subunit SecG [Desulfuromonadales bacterium]|jgi:preprotein translocase subunit SecG